MSSRPVGFFDSGLGGLCILEAFKKECPLESTVYIADSANCPYGNKSAEDIVNLSDANVKRLLDKDCKIIVVACNTASAAALEYLRAKYPAIPFVGIEPAIKPAAIESKTGVVGVLATAGTFNGRLYNETKAKFAKNVTIIATVADEFVDLVERGLTSGLEAERIVREKIESLLAARCDKIVLGCTHFPHLKPLIEKVAGNKAEIIEPSQAVALRAKYILKNANLMNDASLEPRHIFISTKKDCD